MNNPKSPSEFRFGAQVMPFGQGIFEFLRAVDVTFSQSSPALRKRNFYQIPGLSLPDGGLSQAPPPPCPLSKPRTRPPVRGFGFLGQGTWINGMPR